MTIMESDRHQIRIREVPLWMSFRDILLTLCAWAIIVYFLREAIELAIDYFRYPYFQLVTTKRPDWHGMWGDLQSFVIFAVCLISWLAFWAFSSKRKLRSSAMVSQPKPLSLAEHAASLDLTEEQLRSCKSSVITTVFFDRQRRITSLRFQERSIGISMGHH